MEYAPVTHQIEASLHFAPSEPARGFILVGGEDRVAFLQGLVSNDLRRLDGEHGLWAAFLSPQGKFLYDMFLYPMGEAILIETEGARVADLAQRLARHILRAKVTIDNVSDRFELFHAWGVNADGVESTLIFGLPAPGTAVPFSMGIVLADPRHALLGVRVALPRGTGVALLTDKGFKLVPFMQWDHLRLTLGVPDGSRDLEIDRSILLENGFDELNGVAWDKGCYMGQELTARTKYRALIKKRLLPVQFSGPALPAGTPVLSGVEEVGILRSSQAGIGLALLRLEDVKAERPMTLAGHDITVTIPQWAKI